MSTISIAFETDRFLQLAAFLKENGSKRDPVDVIGEAVDYWLDNAEWKLDKLLPDARATSNDRGYTWRIRKKAGRAASSLFLPSGTTMRIYVDNQYEYAEIRGDRIYYKGEVFNPNSPNQFAYIAAGNERDAWRDVWIMLPGDAQYQQADALRQKTLSSVLGES